MKINLKNKAWDYFKLAATVGPLVFILLNNLTWVVLQALFGNFIKISDFFFFILMMVIPFYIMFFIPFGLLGILTLVLIRKYYNKISLKKLKFYLVALSGFCFPVLTAYSFGIIESLEDLLRSKITLNEIIPSIFWHVKIAFSMYMGAGGFIPTLPNLYTVFIYSFSLIIVCFFLLSLFIKQNNKMITEASN